MLEHTVLLPNAPGELLQTPTQSSIAGVVRDKNGATISDARVTLVQRGQQERTSITDSHGSFYFSGLSAGEYTITVTANLLDTFVSTKLELRQGEILALPDVVLAIATEGTSIQVTASREEIAQEQVRSEEKQRFLGVFPNFYSSYIWDAEPLSRGQKFGLATHSVIDPIVFVATGAVAGLEQSQNVFPQFGSGVDGYSMRFAADYGDELSSRMFASAIFPVLLKQDPRYFYKGAGSIGSRASYALTRTFVTRSDRGQSVPNYSRVLGALAAGALSNAYHLSDDRGVSLTFRNVAIALGGHAADNLLREFLFRRFTTNVPHLESN